MRVRWEYSAVLRARFNPPQLAAHPSKAATSALHMGTWHMSHLQARYDTMV